MVKFVISLTYFNENAVSITIFQGYDLRVLCFYTQMLSNSLHPKYIQLST